MEKITVKVSIEGTDCYTRSPMRTHKKSSWQAACLVALLAGNTGAQSLEPRQYSNAPVGLNFLLGGYVYSTGAALADPTVDLKDGELELNMPIVAYARSFGLLGKSSKFDVVVPYGFLSGSAKVNGTLVQREVDGFADPSFRVSMNFFGAPALALPEFMSYKQNIVFGGSLQIVPPLGQYDSSKIVNLGSNRWTIKPELGVSKKVGPVILELATSAALFTDNTDYNNGQRKAQDPLYSAQGHLVYIFPKGLWAAFDWTYYAGGRSTVDGIEKQDRQENSRIGATLALPVNKQNSIKLYMSTGVSTRTGSDFDTYGLLWQYRWGAGL